MTTPRDPGETPGESEFSWGPGMKGPMVQVHGSNCSDKQEKAPPPPPPKPKPHPKEWDE
jgi:hypothetical protein